MPSGSGTRHLGPDFGSRVPRFGSRVSSFGFRVSGLGSQVAGVDFQVSCFGFWVSGLGFRASCFWFWVSGLGIQVSGGHTSWCRVRPTACLRCTAPGTWALLRPTRRTSCHQAPRLFVHRVCAATDHPENSSTKSCTHRYTSQFENNYFTEMCSGSEAGWYSRLIDFVYHSTLGLQVKKKKKTQGFGVSGLGCRFDGLGVAGVPRS